MQEARLVSVQVGPARAYRVDSPVNEPGRLADVGAEVEGTWLSGFAKTPVEGPVWLGSEQLEGDEQADRQNHGGPDKAVLAYAASHYPVWQGELGRALPYGSFAENFTIAGLDETTVCIGDVYRVGEAEVEVAQPRVPCWKIERFWGLPGLTERVRTSGRSGWYLRVLRPGWIAAGQAVELCRRPCPEWTVARVNDLIHGRDVSRASLAALLNVPALAAAVREHVERRLRAVGQP
ncbi:MOSC domain-containing protein [Alicyclobacillus herbarius]|uniref:MOSC domain-containing protein n=1 Tax=Alicyclobacillus herbarius TaxID=122960 RepID=UPI0004099355|nr:MOSC domain-containing protein [Alicyclobacillus herbarius]